MTLDCRIGVRIHGHQAPESVLAYARAIERLGFDDVWVVEDISYAGGLTAAAAVLAATSRVAVGVGILATVVRNPMYLLGDRRGRRRSRRPRPR
jgi:alkanesulfonate monooxygenase SsuD/methylene tetrahydromethanopterin reductase-like flavin-dependent oxidoreductase (luciferase family)